jgi:hypothetical protein
LECLGDGRAEELDEEADPEVEQKKNHPNSSLTEPPISEDSGKKSRRLGLSQVFRHRVENQRQKIRRSPILAQCGQNRLQRWSRRCAL